MSGLPQRRDEYSRVSSWSLYVSTGLLWIVAPSVELEILVGVLLLDSNNNNNNHNNIFRINRDDETLVKSGKFKDYVSSWKFEKNGCKLSSRFFGLGVFACFSCAHVPGCVIGRYCGSSGDNDWKIRICVSLPSSICCVLGLMPCQQR